MMGRLRTMAASLLRGMATVFVLALPRRRTWMK
jgi:hypothetical protein